MSHVLEVAAYVQRRRERHKHCRRGGEKGVRRQGSAQRWEETDNGHGFTLLTLCSRDGLEGLAAVLEAPASDVTGWPGIGRGKGAQAGSKRKPLQVR